MAQRKAPDIQRRLQTKLLFTEGLSLASECPGNGTLDYEVYEIISSGLTNGGGRFTTVDIDTSASLPTLTYTMFEAGVQEEQGRLTIHDDLVDGAGVISHEVLYCSDSIASEYKECQTNVAGPTYAYPVVETL